MDIPRTARLMDDICCQFFAIAHAKAPRDVITAEHLRNRTEALSRSYRAFDKQPLTRVITSKALRKALRETLLERLSRAGCLAMLPLEAVLKVFAEIIDHDQRHQRRTLPAPSRVEGQGGAERDLSRPSGASFAPTLTIRTVAAILDGLDPRVLRALMNVGSFWARSEHYDLLVDTPISVAQYLIGERGFNVNAVGCCLHISPHNSEEIDGLYYPTPLHNLAISREDYPDKEYRLRLLLRAGAETRVLAQPHRETPLHFAVRNLCSRDFIHEILQWDWFHHAHRSRHVPRSCAEIRDYEGATAEDHCSEYWFTRMTSGFTQWRMEHFARSEFARALMGEGRAVLLFIARLVDGRECEAP